MSVLQLDAKAARHANCPAADSVCQNLFRFPTGNVTQSNGHQPPRQSPCDPTRLRGRLPYATSADASLPANHRGDGRWRADFEVPRRAQSPATTRASWALALAVSPARVCCFTTVVTMHQPRVRFRGSRVCWKASHISASGCSLLPVAPCRLGASAAYNAPSKSTIRPGQRRGDYSLSAVGLVNWAIWLRPDWLGTRDACDNSWALTIKHLDQ